jgi:RsiW-degrading membrane proteinase PrsW (M82 family)
MNLFSLLALAVAPGVAIGLYIYLKDQHEREPLSLLLISFLYGMLSTVITLVVSFPLNIFLSTKPHDVVGEFYNAFFKVALVEELSKFLFVRFVLFNNKNFNEPFDGIVYAVMVSMGFATVENIIYVYDFGVTTGILRMFTAVPAHGIFGVLMGYFVGKARFAPYRKFYYSVIALCAAAVLHGAYDYFWFLSHLPALWIGGVASLVLGFVLARKAIRLHQQASPFLVKSENQEADRPEN